MTALRLGGEQVDLLPVDYLEPGPWQPRRVFEAKALSELASSIASVGILTPLRVVPSGITSPYLILAGERRWRAAKLAGFSHVPCLVIDASVPESELRELAIVDNLHRSNLRPGEEARAIAILLQGGGSQKQLAHRLGKSTAWVSNRVSIASLPDEALLRLDLGELTREEALLLHKLIDTPDLILACLEASGDSLRQVMRGHIPTGLSERIQAVRRELEIERQRNAWIVRARASGRRVLDDLPHDGDRRYVKLLQGSAVSQLHQEARLACEVWAWDSGQPVRFCDNPAALHSAEVSAEHDARRDHQADEVRQVRQREAVRDLKIGAWLATTRELDISDLFLLAQERIRLLTLGNDRLLAKLGKWLGTTGEPSDYLEYGKAELATRSERRIIQLWFALEVAQATSATVIPEWTAPWLERLGIDEDGDTLGLRRVD